MVCLFPFRLATTTFIVDVSVLSSPLHTYYALRQLVCVYVLSFYYSMSEPSERMVLVDKPATSLVWFEGSIN